MKSYHQTILKNVQRRTKAKYDIKWARNGLWVFSFGMQIWLFFFQFEKGVQFNYLKFRLSRSLVSNNNNKTLMMMHEIIPHNLRSISTFHLHPLSPVEASALG